MRIGKSVWLVLLLFFPSGAQQQNPAGPDTLTVPQTQQLDSIEKIIRIGECCNGSLFSCLREKPACTMARRFNALAKWLMAKRTSPQTIVDEINKRYDCLTSQSKSSIDTSAFPIVGDQGAPVLIMAYVSGTCPLCHRITRELYAAVAKGGPLFGKARLTVKPFGKATANLSMCAANKLGRFWDFFIALSSVQIRADSAVVFHVADSIGIKPGVLSALIKDPQTLAMASASMQEADRNDVTVAPTVYLSGVRYKSYKDPRWIIDAAEYLFEARTDSTRPGKK
jgi:protein-disulfide isomerase